MAISEKTRKILWGRSGNRCALCRRELVIDSTAADDESVVGEECHIVSSKPQGPRYDPTFPAERLDQPENLILLCRVHHKLVDDQRETYTVDALQKYKAKHESWVSSSLTDEKRLPRIRFRRIKENIPHYLIRLVSGQDVMKIVGSSDSFSFSNDEPQSEAEVDLLAGFFQEVQDWGDLWAGFEAGKRIRAEYRVTELLREVEEAGFWVFGGREVQQLEGGDGQSVPWSVSILQALRTTNTDIIRIPLQTEESEVTDPHAPNNSPPDIK